MAQMALPENSTHCAPANKPARSGPRRHSLAHRTRRWAFIGGAFAALLLAASAGCTTGPQTTLVSRTNAPQSKPAEMPASQAVTDGVAVMHTGEQVTVTGQAISGSAAVGVPITLPEVPEQVLITGSLIRGSAAVGVPVTNLSPQDSARTGALTSSDLFRTIPRANGAPPPPSPAAAPPARFAVAPPPPVSPAPYSSLLAQRSFSNQTAIALAQAQNQPNSERYPNASPNPVKSVAQEPVSTFSMDVDTASYSNVRRYLVRGALPPTDSVRVEEMINYFDYHYSVPRDRAAPFQPTVAVYPSPWNPDTQILHIGIKGFDLARSERPRANLVFLIDSSGSMEAPNKLPLLKQSFRLLVEQLRPEDRVTIVTYAGQAGLVLPPTSGAEKDRILNAMYSLNASGSTAGGEGIRLAYRLAEENFDREGVNRVILATDGDFNVGITDPNALADFVASQRASGVFLNTLGFGFGNYNDLTMQKLAQAGNGVAAYVDNLNEARKIFVDQIAGTLFTIAKDVKVQVEFNPARVAEYRLIGYETRLLQTNDFNNDKVDAGDIGTGHTVTALYEITPVGSKAQLADPLRYAERPVAGSNDTNELAYVKIRYKLPAEDESQLITRPVTKADVQTDFGKLPADFRFAAAVAGTGQLLRRDASLKDFDYHTALELAEGAVGEDEFGYRREFVKLLSGLAGPLASLPVYRSPGAPVALTSHSVTADDYPAVSIRLQEQGTVQVRYFVNTSGDVGDCQVTGSSGMARLDDAACRMVKARWKFRPAVVNDGTPIPVWLDGQITFQLQ